MAERSEAKNREAKLKNREAKILKFIFLTKSLLAIFSEIQVNK